MKQLVFALTAVLAATPALARPRDAASVYIGNEAGPSGLLDGYVDGLPVAEDVFPSTSTTFPVELAAGEHAVTVTRANQAPAQGTLLRGSLQNDEGAAVTLVYTLDRRGQGVLDVGGAVTTPLD